EVDVTVDEEGGHAHAHGERRGGRDEGERIDELLHHQREGEDDHREDPRYRNGDDDLHEGPEPAMAVDHRGLFQVAWDGLEEAHEQPRAEGDREGRVDDYQRPEAVLEPEVADHPRHGDEQERRRDEAGAEDPEAELRSEERRVGKEWRRGWEG